MPSKYGWCEECCQPMEGEASSLKLVVWCLLGNGAAHLLHPVSRGQSEERNFQFLLRQSFTVISLLKCFEFLKFHVSRMQCIHYRMHFLKPSAVGDN